MRASEKLYDPAHLRTHFPNGCDYRIGRFEIFENPIYGDERPEMAIGFSKLLAREIVFDCLLSGDDDCDLDELERTFADAEEELFEPIVDRALEKVFEQMEGKA